jgi:hypothetical protein
MKKITTLLTIGAAAIGIQSASYGSLILNSVDWTTAGLPAYGTLQGTSNNITINSAPYNNAGQLFNFDWGNMPFAANFNTSTSSAIAIGYTSGNSTTTLTFSNSISNLSLWFNYIDTGNIFDFSGLNWTFIAGNSASRVGNTVVTTGGNSDAEGFLINISGAFGPSTPLSFTIMSNYADTAGFTLSTPAPSNAVPEPGQVAASLLLLAGIGGYVFMKRRKAAKAVVPAVA